MTGAGVQHTTRGCGGVVALLAATREPDGAGACEVSPPRPGLQPPERHGAQRSHAGEEEGYYDVGWKGGYS
eukprot:718925-Pyramimonas_sp.AAC.1